MLDFSDVNYWAVVVAWLVNVAVGAFWYSPVGFGKQWAKHTGIDIMKMPQDEASKTIAFVALSAVPQALVLAVILASLQVSMLADGLMVGFALWLGLTAATTVGNTLYSKLGWKHWWLNSSYFLVVMIINSAILTVWR